MRKLAFTLMLIAGSSSAQYSPPIPLIDPAWQATLGAEIFTTQMNEMMLEQNLKAATANDDDADARSLDVSSLSSAKSSVQLDFTPSMQRRRANYASFVERTRRVDPAGAAGLEANLKRDPIALAEPELAKVGLRVDNVADAYAVYWVEAWQAVHGVNGASSRATAQAVRAQAARAISATPEFASATAAQKQEFAESYLVQAVMVGAAKEQAAGDPAKLAQVSAAVEKGARAAGLDLRAMTLTEEGFRPAG